MSEKKNKVIPFKTDKKSWIEASRSTLEKLLPLSGSEALNILLDHKNPGALIKTMSNVDLFWLVKKIGEDDAYPILKLATKEQWQYILDMETWEKDLIDINKTFEWLSRLYKADPERLPAWLYSEDGNLHAHFYFHKVLEVKIKDDDDFSPPEGFITFDNLYYIRILDKEHEDEIEQMVRSMALEDHNRYQALLIGLIGVIPAEIEEEMYRLKGVRLAEIGYLPYEEAISVYAYQKPGQLKKDYSEYELYYPEEDKLLNLVPLTPLAISGGTSIFSIAVSEMKDHLVLERLRLEFAGLCNQIFSADNIEFEGIEVLRRITEKASGYINIGLEDLSEGDISTAQQYIRKNPLISLFRAGFSLALNLKWEGERWISNSWYKKQGLDYSFWGEEWGGTLEGILKKRPLYYSAGEGANNYRDFSQVTEITESQIILHRIIFLDKLLENITSIHPGIENFSIDPMLNFYPIVFTFWARTKLGVASGYMPLSHKEAEDFFDIVRDEEKEPPYLMNRYKNIFRNDMISLAATTGTNDAGLSGETLDILWEEFSREYSMVRLSDLNARFSRFILLEP